MQAFQKLQEATARNNSVLCVGLDTELSKLPGHFPREKESIIRFNEEIISATKDCVNSYKINFAFYEQYGRHAFGLIERTIAAIPKDIMIIADAKRGDIGNTSRAYANAVFNELKCDSVTVSPYMGGDSVKPFLEYEEKMVFLLCLTSNPGSRDFEYLNSGGMPLYKHVMKRSMEWADEKRLGYVVGATHPSELAELREMAGGHAFLIPGIGAQGGDAEATLKANGAAPALVNLSRAVIYASPEKDFAEKARETALSYRDLFNSVRNT